MKKHLLIIAAAFLGLGRTSLAQTRACDGLPADKKALANEIFAACILQHEAPVRGPVWRGPLLVPPPLPAAAARAASARRCRKGYRVAGRFVEGCAPGLALPKSWIGATDTILAGEPVGFTPIPPEGQRRRTIHESRIGVGGPGCDLRRNALPNAGKARAKLDPVRAVLLPEIRGSTAVQEDAHLALVLPGRHKMAVGSRETKESHSGHTPGARVRAAARAARTGIWDGHDCNLVADRLVEGLASGLALTELWIDAPDAVLALQPVGSGAPAFATA